LTNLLTKALTKIMTKTELELIFQPTQKVRETLFFSELVLKLRLQSKSKHIAKGCFVEVFGQGEMVM
jgi:hypothetical protein